jgi:hypothetical protein
MGMDKNKMIPDSARKSNLCMVFFGLCLLLLGVMFIHASIQRRTGISGTEHMAGLVKNLELTDLCLFTEARYTRNLSQADLHSAFQDHPSSLEHFPAGSVAGPPAGIRRNNVKLD